VCVIDETTEKPFFVVVDMYVCAHVVFLCVRVRLYRYWLDIEPHISLASYVQAWQQICCCQSGPVAIPSSSIIWKKTKDSTLHCSLNQMEVWI
jgi:hypothetical protein